jgi:hypothetical protein
MAWMAYQRGLEIENGRWAPKHSIFWELIDELIQSVNHCPCCPGPVRKVIPNTLLAASTGYSAAEVRLAMEAPPKDDALLLE